MKLSPAMEAELRLYRASAGRPARKLRSALALVRRGLLGARQDFIVRIAYHWPHKWPHRDESSYDPPLERWTFWLTDTGYARLRALDEREERGHG